MDSLRRWTDRKSKHILNNDQKYKREGIFHTKELSALCLICNLKHHTSICDKNENVLLTTYFLVTAKIQGIKGTVMQIEKELINDRLRCSKVS